MKKISEDPFSNGTEYDWWAERNCDRCIKASVLKKDESGYTKVRCAVQRDIFTRMCSNEPISLRSFNACQKSNCPYKVEQRKARRKKADTSPCLQFD